MEELTDQQQQKLYPKTSLQPSEQNGNADNSEQLHRFSVEELREQQNKVKDRYKGGEQELTVLPADYAERVKNVDKDLTFDEIIERAYGIIERPQKEFRRIIEYDAAKSIVWKICKKKSQVINRKFIVDEYNREIIQECVKYFIGDPGGSWNQSKGLLFYGAPGCGKTYLFSVMHAFVQAARIEFRKFDFKKCADISDEVEIDGVKELRKYFNSEYDICFDDFGQEEAVTKRYGNTTSVMERILTKRYDAFVGGKCITHLTTNLNMDEVESIYGTRLRDRFDEMFNLVYWPGTSRRK